MSFKGSRRRGSLLERAITMERLEARHVLAGAPIITEFLASNDNALDDGDGNSSDWIELFNAGDQPVNLNGYHLTNDPSDLSKWSLPELLLQPNEYTIVFASGQDVNDYVDAEGNPHTNFRLAASGDYLALIAPSGSIVSQFGTAEANFPQQLSDVSFGVAQRRTVVEPSSQATHWIPLSSLGTTWTEVDFDPMQNGFVEGTAAVGFESKPDDRNNFVGQFTTEVPDRTHAVYVRAEFDVNRASAISDLVLHLKYDNGFIVYLNGVRVAEDNAPPPALSDWFSPAPDRGRRDSDVLEAVTFDLGEHIDKLVDGKNVLAIHGLNYLQDNTDLLIVPELVAAASDMKAAFGAEPKQGYMTSPSPGAANVSSAEVLSSFVSDTRFSINRGFYTEPINVEITTDTAEAQIRYTTDGTWPTSDHGEVYSGPITIDTTTTLRAAAFRDDFIPTNADTHSYFFLNDVIDQSEPPEGYPDRWAGMPADYGMDPDVVGPDNLFNDVYRNSIVDDLQTLPTLSLVFDPEHMFGREGLYQRPTSTGDRYEYPTSVEFMSPDGSEDGFQINSGIRIMGGSSRQPDIPKHSFRLEFREQYGTGKLLYPLFKDQPFGEEAVEEFDELMVRTGFNNSWMHRHYYQSERGEQPRDQWVRDLQLAMGHHSGRGRYLQLYLNGMYWGIYNIQERPAAPFMADYFGGDKNSDWDVVSSGDAVDGDTRAWRDLNTLVNRGVRTAEEYAAVQESLDVVNLIDYMILNFYIGNTDWDGHNWIAARPRTEDGKFRFYAWDSEFAISLPPSNEATGENAERQIINTNRTSVSGGNRPTNLHQKLLRSDEYRLLFADRIQKHMFNDGVLTPERSTEIFLNRSEQLDRAVVAESARWGDYRRDVNPGRWPAERFDLYHRDEHYVNQLDFIINRYLPVRTEIAFEQMKRQRLYPELAAPSFTQHGGNVTPNFPLQISAEENAAIHYTTDGFDPRDAATNGPSASAATYVANTPVRLTESLTVKARALKDGDWSALNEATFVVSPTDSSNLRITEINYNPLPPTENELARMPELDDSDFEFIEVQNVAADSISLAGLRFDQGIDFTFPFTALPAGEYGVVVRDRNAFQLRYGADINIIGEFDGTLSNRGERLSLAASDEETIFEVQYSDNGLWPAAADGSGATLELIDAASVAADQLSKFYHWRSSSTFGGTPGAAGDTPLGVIINEVLSNPGGNDGQTDAIELLNTTEAAIDIGGWYLSDSDEQFRKFQIPVGSILGPGQYIAFTSAEFNPTPDNAAPQHFGLSARGDDVWLVAADDSGAVTRLVDDVHFGGAAEGESFGRVSPTNRLLAPLTSVTLGADNSQPRVGPIIISEVNYAPESPSTAAFAHLRALQPDDLEFVEIVNPTSTEVSLKDWRLRGGIQMDFDDSITLSPNQALTVVSFDPDDPDNARRLAAFRAQYGLGDNVSVVGGFQGRLSNSGERIRLLRPVVEANDVVARVLEDEITYDNLAPWPQAAAGQGQSLHRVSTDGWGNLADSWTSAAPNPGMADQLFGVVGDANGDGRFDQLDLTSVLARGKYLSGGPAELNEGDWNGDGAFDQLDVVFALQSDQYVGRA